MFRAFVVLGAMIIILQIPIVKKRALTVWRRIEVQVDRLLAPGVEDPATRRLRESGVYASPQVEEPASKLEPMPHSLEEFNSGFKIHFDPKGSKY